MTWWKLIGLVVIAVGVVESLICGLWYLLRRGQHDHADRDWQEEVPSAPWRYDARLNQYVPPDFSDPLSSDRHA